MTSFGRAPAGAWRDHPCPQGALVAALMTAVAVLVIGGPALAAPRTVTLGHGPDVQLFVWGLRWWPYAIAHGLDPFVSQRLWPPDGVSTLWTTTVPALALLAAPVTLTLGPVLAYNALVTLAPVSAGCATYLLCRELDLDPWPAALAGVLFAFSGYEQSQGLAHLQLTACAVVPLTLWVLVRFARGQISRSGVVARVAGLVALQALISVEVLTTMLVIGALTALGRWITCPDRRDQTVRVVGWATVGVLASLPVTGLLLVEMLRHMPQHALNPAQSYSIDLLNPILPTRHALIGGSWAASVTHSFSGNLAEQDGYLGIPLLATTAVALRSRRHHTLERTAACALLASVILSLGPRLHIAGHPIMPMPGIVFSNLPLLRDVIPVRLALYTTLATAIVTARWIDRSTMNIGGRCLLASVLVLVLIPAAASAHGTSKPAAMATIAPGSTVISLPFWDTQDRAIELQAQTGFRFKLIDHWAQDTPNRMRPFAHTPALYGRDLPEIGHALIRALCRHQIDYAIIWPGYRSQAVAAALHAAPPTDGVPSIARLHCDP